MGTLYARVGGTWVPVITPPQPVVDEVWVGPSAPTAAETELWVDADQTPAPMLYAKIGGTWTSVSSPPTNEVAVQPEPPTGSEELWYDSDAPGYAPDDLRWLAAWGVIGMTVMTSNSTGYNTTSSPGWPITALSTTVTTVANRRYRISCDVATYADQDNVEINFVIRRDGVIAQQCNFPSPKANYGVRNFVELFDTPTAGSHTYSMATWMTLGAGLFHVNASPSQPLQLVVEDVGPVAGTGTAPMQLVDRWNTAWGQIVATPYSNVAVNAANGVYVTVQTTTATLLVGRQYVFAINQTGSYGQITGETWGFAGAVTDATTPIPEHYWQVTNANQYLIPSTLDSSFTVTSTGVKTASIAIRRVAGSGLMQARVGITIFDVGPVSGAVATPDPTPAWINATLENGWVNFGSGYQTTQYRKVGDEVQVRGMIRAGSVNATAFTLPVGYRTTYTAIHFAVMSNDAAGLVRVYPDGRVTPATGTSGSWVELAPIRFSVSA